VAGHLLLELSTSQRIPVIVGAVDLGGCAAKVAEFYTARGGEKEVLDLGF
jgi:hypothetical protein